VQRLLREGGGRLSDNIPPPDPEERAEADADMAEVEVDLLIPGLELTSAQPPTRITVRPRGDPEVERLRILLAETLHELQMLRGMLP
jgi:hypothetical protein